MKINNMIERKKKLANDRLKICEKCDQYLAEAYRCQICGCNMMVKTLFPFVDCPLNKWEELKREQNNGPEE